MSENFLITGKNGMLAYAFINSNLFNNIKYYSHSELDISNHEQLEKVFSENNIDFLINCAAYTNVTEAENDFETACLTNFIGVKNLVTICNKFKMKLVHFSTDYVFKGDKNVEYFEDNKTNPVNKYGESKYLGEKYIVENSNDFLILRVSWLYGPNGKNFVSTVSKLMKDRDTLNIVSDQFGKTTYTLDIVSATKELLDIKANGIYHFANHGASSRYEFSLEMYKILKDKYNLNCDINQISSDEYPDNTPRPKYSILNTDKYEKLTGTTIPHWKESLKKYIDTYLILNDVKNK